MRYRQLFESDSLQMKVMSGSELGTFIGRHEKENRKTFERLRYLHPVEMDREIHIAHFDGKRVVSSLALQQNPYDDSELWLKHVVVDEDYRNRGLASELYQAAVDYAREHGKAIMRSSATKMGKAYLTHVVDRIKKQNPDVEIRNQDK